MFFRIPVPELLVYCQLFGLAFNFLLSESLFRNFWFIANFSDWLSTFFFQFFVNFSQNFFVNFFQFFVLRIPVPELLVYRQLFGLAFNFL